jgi:ElaB/YqjD/DUF883 family membrane-anchored ribosome-binding protein
MDDTAHVNQPDELGTDADTERRARELRGEIEETRGEMSETIDAIQEKLRPSTIVANATDQVKAATTEKVRAMADTAGEMAQDAMYRTRETAGGVMNVIRENPIPATLIGIGAAWLLMNPSRGNAKRSSRSSYADDYGTSSDFESYENEGRGYGESLREAGSRAREYVGGTTRAIKRSSRQAQRGFQRVLSENPLLVGAGALLLGAAFGLVVPETERENELMGEARDTVVERAQQAASETANKIQEKASGVAEAASSVADSISGRRSS